MIRLQTLLEKLSKSEDISIISTHATVGHNDSDIHNTSNHDISDARTAMTHDISTIPIKDRTVSRVEFLTDTTILASDILYLTADEKILQNPRLTQRILHAAQPCLILTTLDLNVPFPLFSAPKTTDINALFHSISEQLRFEEQFQYEINELYHLLYTGKGLEDIILHAEVLLGRAVSVLDAGYSMLAVSPMMLQLPFGVESSEAGHFLSAQEVESLRRLQIEHQIYQHTQAFFIQTEDHPDTNWIFCAIRIQHVMSGYVAVCLPKQANATEHELRLTTAISDICAIEMQKHDFFVRQTGLQYETLLIDLIEGRFNNLSMVESRFRVLKHHSGKFFCLAILYCSEPHNSELFNRQQMSTLRKTFANSMSVVYRNNIVLLINQDEPVLLCPKLTEPLEQFAGHNHLKVILSQPFADILKTNMFYEQAQHTLDLSDMNDPDQRLFFSTEALPEYLFSKCSYAELESGIHYHIFQLRDYDREYHTEFITTLRAYLNHDRNATQTAEYLHIHRSTLFYRIRKMEDLLDIRITDSKLLLLYELSLKIWDYLSR
ncbi:MAG: helix-turn-helix domain-containing protein [Clostridiales bacterium]|nr:helix-turn-helix domain-containing protein [Clostridiales bacterium]